MNRKFFRIAAWVAAVALLTNSVIPLGSLAANGHDDPGTQITNNASAVYKDAAGNSYNTTSNTVTTTVQNAPTLTNTAASGSAYAPGQTISDVFTLTNTGNFAGDFQVSDTSSPPTGASDAVLGGSDSSSATLGNGAATCVTPVGSQASQ